MAQERIRTRIANIRFIGRTAFEHIDTADDDILRYHFSQRTIPFCGREKELSRLQDFLCSEAAFSWWAITGQTGAGKSRLAFEFIRQLPVSWFGFFANDRSTQKDIEQFKPFCNTLIIMTVWPSACKISKMYKSSSDCSKESAKELEKIIDEELQDLIRLAPKEWEVPEGYSKESREKMALEILRVGLRSCLKIYRMRS